MDELTHTSPGELLLYLVIEDCTNRGYTSFDLGRGEERYKSSWCNEVVPMFENFIPVSKKATVLIAFDRIKVTFKRFIKQNPKLWQFAKRVRAKRTVGK
jgi:CelD/BcsL family acetyltransferase involved in cellulose biosynthesis